MKSSSLDLTGKARGNGLRRTESKSTLFAAIDAAVARDATRAAVVWIGEDGSRASIQAGELHRSAMGRAHALRRHGIASGELVLLALPYSPDLLSIFLGAIYGAAIPAILPYVTDQAAVAAQVERVRRLAAAAEARAVICPGFLAAPLGDALRSVCEVIDTSMLAGVAETWSVPASVGQESAALIQFTSGTTGGQKGVRVSHAAVLSFLQGLALDLEVTQRDVIVSWLPLYHDLGVITGLLFPLFQGISTVLMSPAHWVRAPVVMLRAMHDFKGTLTWMPNFAFSHMARTVRDADLEGLDLSAWRHCANGAEPVREDSIAAFSARLEPCGMRSEAIRAGYGMAENVLTATLSRGRPRVDRISAADLQTRRIANPLPPSAAGAVAFVSNGSGFAGAEVAIADEQGRRLPEREVGEILVRSPHLFEGYHLRPDLTAAAMRDGWFRSGDLGYLAGGELYICGRKKDLIIVRGANISPEDVEAIADRTPGIQAGRAVAFGVADAETGTERIVVVAELREPLPEGGAGAVERALRKAVLEGLGTPVSAVRFVERGWITKTSSGKLPRAASRERYLQHFGETIGN
jgi:acyl-CoA synthetase (AMP-forming)/AMP-acid ligase II